MLLAMVVAIVLTYRLGRRRHDGVSAAGHLRPLVAPSVLLLAPPLIVAIDRQLTMTGAWSAAVRLIANGVFYLATAWLLWVAILAVAEAIIASKYIRERSLNAQLVRLIARTLGALAVLLVILQLSNRLGAPLYSLACFGHRFGEMGVFRPIGRHD